MGDLYTHTYEFDFGGTFLKGEIEFDTDNKMTFNIKQSGDPMPSEVYDYCLQLLELIKKIYDSKNTLNLVKIKLKE